MTPLHCQAFLFDMDGTLIDSTATVLNSWMQWCTEHDVDPMRLKDKHGLPALSIVRELLPHFDDEGHQRAAVRAAEIEIDGAGGSTPLAGALDLLASLPADRWAVVTSCSRDLAEARLAAAGIPAAAVLVTSSDTTRGKPHPEPYLLGADRLGWAPSDCLVVEDAPAGLTSGRAAGCQTVGVTTHYGPDLLEADLVVPDLTELHVTLGAGGSFEVRGPGH